MKHVTTGQTLAAMPRHFLGGGIYFNLVGFQKHAIILSFFFTPFLFPVGSITKIVPVTGKGWVNEREKSIISCSLFFPFPSCFCFLASEAVSAIFNFLLFSLPLLSPTPFLSVGRIKNSWHASPSFLSTKERAAASSGMSKTCTKKTTMRQRK